MTKELKVKATKVSASNDVESGKICAALAYILIGIIWFFVDDNMKKNTFAKFHVKQGLVVMALSLAFWIISWIVIMPMMFIPGLGIGLFMIFRLIGLVILVLAIIGIVYALQGKEKELPIVGKYGAKFNI
jgi:uncharacterized membrane protein